MGIQDNNFRIRMKEGAIKDYEKAVLTEVNDIFMPMGFMSYDQGEVVSYNCSGYSSLKQCNITEVLEALEILERTFTLVSRAGEYLITPSRIMLTLDTIFYDRKTGQVRIAYVPVDSENNSLRDNISGFIREMGGVVRENGKEYLDKVKSEMDENNYYIRDLINIIGEIRRDAVRDCRREEEIL